MLTVLSFLAIQTAYSMTCPEYWGKIIELNHSYNDQHLTAAGEQLLKLLPTKNTPGPKGCDTEGEALRILDRDADFRQKQLGHGERLGFSLSFRLKQIADGAFSEGLDIDLGHTIAKYPELFLENLKKELGNVCDGGLTGNTGEYGATSDRPELIRRKQSLLKVKRADLVSVRDLCVSQLNKQLASKEP